MITIKIWIHILINHLCRSQDIGEGQPYSVQGLANICKIEFDTSFKNLCIFSGLVIMCIVKFDTVIIIIFFLAALARKVSMQKTFFFFRFYLELGFRMTEIPHQQCSYFEHCSQRALTNPHTKKMSRMICQAHVLVQYDPIHPKKFQNRALRGFCTICIFVFFH